MELEKATGGLDDDDDDDMSHHSGDDHDGYDYPDDPGKFHSHIEEEEEEEEDNRSFELYVHGQRSGLQVRDRLHLMGPSKSAESVLEV